MKVLFVNACVRGKDSRTDSLCRDYISKLPEGTVVTEINLDKEGMKPLDAEMLQKRDGLLGKKSFDDPMFDYAKQMMEADHVIIGAPYWDLSFPALLKIYLEQCSVTGLTYIYNEKGIPEGQCKAKSLTYITTSGGPIGDLNFGYDYIKGLCLLFGIPRTDFISAEALDVWGNDVEAIMASAKEKITELAKTL
ncbi:MAG: NAD(P)H-dependent oxidoreductase [Firmicutes bacterium]|nr:NAD(P)H-dependent oxidoreductase [Bacillota bacterium]